MSLVTLSEAQARSGDAVTQDHIDEVEELLTRLIGPLVGERTETFLLGERNDCRLIDGLYLTRYTDAAIVTHDGDLMTAGTDYRLVSNYIIDRIRSGTSWSATITATYTPTDEETVRSVIYDGLTYSQTPAGLQSIRIGAYSETYFPTGTRSSSSADPVFGAFLRKILPAAGLGLTSPFRYAGTTRARTLIEATGS